MMFVSEDRALEASAAPSAPFVGLSHSIPTISAPPAPGEASYPGHPGNGRPTWEASVRRRSCAWPRGLALALALTMACFLGMSPAVADEVDSSVDRALEGSAVTSQLEDLPAAALSAVPNDAFRERVTRREALDFLKERAGKDELLSPLRTAVKEDVDPDSLKKVIEFQESKVGKKAAKAQSTALESNSIKSVREGRAVLLSLRPERTELLKRIMVAQDSAEFTAALLKKIVRGFVEGCLSAALSGAASSDQMRQKAGLIEKQIDGERNSQNDMALVSYAHVFRSLDDKELEILAAHEESPAAGVFRKAVRRGMEQAVTDLAKSLGEFTVKPHPPAKKRPERPTPTSRSPRTESEAEAPPKFDF